MSEINAAYDQIMTSRRGGGYQSAESGYASSQGFDSGYLRSLIQSGSYTQADQILDNVSASERNAEWYFLKGTICHRRGWLNGQQLHRAVAQMVTWVSSVLAQMNRQRSGYMSGNPTQGHYRRARSGPDCCSSLCCADCCCEMMGGDRIPCC